MSDSVSTTEPAHILVERQAIENAPVVLTTGGMIGRCSWCGQVSQDLRAVDIFHGIERFKCAERCHAG